MLNWSIENRRRFLWITFSTALIVRIVFIAVLNKDGFYFSDARHYDNAAIDLLEGNGFDISYTRAPLYPVIMAGIYYLFGHSFFIMRTAQALLGALLCILVFKIADRVFDSRIAALAAFFAVFYPHFIFISGLLYPTLLFTVLVALTIFFLLKVDLNLGFRNSILAGECAGLAMLAEASMIFFMPFLAIWIFAHFKSSWRKRGVFFALVFATAFLVMSPWLIRGYRIYGRLTLVRPIPHTVLPNLDDPSQTQKEVESGWATTTEYRINNPTGTDKDSIFNLALVYLKNPFGTLRHIFSELPHFWALYPDRLDTKNEDYREYIHSKDQRMVQRNVFLSGFVKIVSIAVMLPVFLLALIGLLQSGFRKSGVWLMLLVVASMALGYSMFYAEVRYRIPVEPYIVVFAAAGISAIIELLLRKKAQPEHVAGTPGNL